MLGDACLERNKPTHNARLRFDQTYPDHKEYIEFLYSIFSNLTGSKPKIHIRKPDIRTGVVYSSIISPLFSPLKRGNPAAGIAFKTRALPCITPYFDMFYTPTMPTKFNINSHCSGNKGEGAKMERVKYLKFVPKNIAEFLTARALAF